MMIIIMIMICMASMNSARIPHKCCDIWKRVKIEAEYCLVA